MKLKLGPIVDDKPVKVTLELPASLHRDLTAYAEALGREESHALVDPVKLIVPMLERFISSDRAFAKSRRNSPRAATSCSALRPRTPPPFKSQQRRIAACFRRLP